MKYLFFVALFTLSSTAFSQDLHRIITKGEWQICNVTDDFQKLSEITLMKSDEEDPCGTWAEHQTERHVTFRKQKGTLAYKESKMVGMAQEQTKGVIATWKLNKKKKTIKFKYEGGVSVVLKIVECTPTKLVLKK